MPLEASRLHRSIAARLRDAGIGTAMLDGRLIISHVTGLSDIELIARPETLVCDGHILRVNEMISRRESGEPVSRLVGHKEFYGREFKVTPDTLDPRPDTEVLVEAGLRLLPDLHGGRESRVLDIGTGTGAIVVTLLAERLFVKGVATDLSREALEVCRNNASRHGVDDRLELVCTNWADAVNGEFDLVVSNPPYIASEDLLHLEPDVRHHDPKLALDGGLNGLDAYRPIFRSAIDLIRTKGHLIVEFGKGQHEAVVQIARQEGMALIENNTGLIRDLAGIIRCAAFKVC
jgi:release factor glutamine methyltransferase